MKEIANFMISGSQVFSLTPNLRNFGEERKNEIRIGGSEF